MFQKTLDSGMAGDNVGILLRGVQKEANRTWYGIYQNQEQLLHIQNLKVKFIFN